jgi:ribosome-associated toxin RatA of RatAB toxin-antitoxin module
MSLIERQTTIAAPSERVFEIVEDPARIMEYVPSVTQVDVISRTSKHIGDSFRAVYSTAGIKMPTTYTTLEYAQAQKIVLGLDGPITGTLAWEFQPHNGGTDVTVRIDYQMKGGLLGKALNALMVERVNEKNAEQMLEGLQALAQSS